MDAFIRGMAPLLEEYVAVVYTQMHDVSVPPPLLRHAAQAGKRSRSQIVDSETAWGLLQRCEEVHGVCVRNVLACKDDEAAYSGLHQANAGRWEKQITLMYMELQKVEFKGVRQVQIVADPSMHGGEESNVGVVNSYERNVAAVAPLTVLNAAKWFDPDKFDMTSAVADLNNVMKTERRAAYKEMQSIIYMATAYTGGDAEQFRKPAGVTIRPVRPGEARVVETSPDGLRSAYIVDVNARTRIREIPTDGPADDEWSHLLVRLDKGSIGKAGANFLMLGLKGDEQQLVLVVYDKLHACIRDIKNTSEDSVYSDMLSTSNHCMTLNYKPWQSGAWEKEKRHILDSFLTLEDENSPFFLSWVEQLCVSFGWTYDGSASMRRAVWHRLGTLASFISKGPLGKLMRWFAWNQCAEFHLPEYWALAMLLRWWFGDASQLGRDNDDAIGLNSMRAGADLNGLKLAMRVMTSGLYIRMKAWLVISRSTWTWYSNEAGKVLGPKEALEAALTTRRNGWWSGELQTLLRTCFCSPADLLWIGFTRTVGDDRQLEFQEQEVSTPCMTRAEPFFHGREGISPSQRVRPNAIHRGSKINGGGEMRLGRASPDLRAGCRMSCMVWCR